MSRKLTEKTTPSTAVTSSNNTRIALFSAALLICFATNSLANRPSMQDSNPNDRVETHNNDHDSAPSAVDIMMRQQQTGDVLNLPAEEIRPGETIKIKLIDLPRRGTSMTKVKQEFGEPVDTSAGVGTPPITSWTYPDRIVYFEYSTVLHVVAR